MARRSALDKVAWDAGYLDNQDATRLIILASSDKPNPYFWAVKGCLRWC